MIVANLKKKDEVPQNNDHVNFTFSSFSIEIDDVLFFKKSSDQNIDGKRLKASVLTSVRLLLKDNKSVDSEGRVEGCFPIYYFSFCF